MDPMGKDLYTYPCIVSEFFVGYISCISLYFKGSQQEGVAPNLHGTTIFPPWFQATELSSEPASWKCLSDLLKNLTAQRRWIDLSTLVPLKNIHGRYQINEKTEQVT